ncbi:hypothetical protein PAPYR_5299 [Paratrimastix pyriformis]|uniref:Uncharacterized protein n=1 Tax=Paratrimastix pyriformis TaxID=342808 RepID=A0ABQ8UHS3_9EUKA|nr:hypothetical protein PAPYR_5299 [Paratrimastix pyriformis]
MSHHTSSISLDSNFSENGLFFEAHFHPPVYLGTRVLRGTEPSFSMDFPHLPSPRMHMHFVSQHPTSASQRVPVSKLQHPAPSARTGCHGNIMKVAIQKCPKDPLSSLVDEPQRLRLKRPPATATNDPLCATKRNQAMAAKPHQSIFDKLTDPKLYTGTHVHRFDNEGHGRGLAGRDSGIDSLTHDLSQMTRPDAPAHVPHPRSPGTKPAAAPAAHVRPTATTPTGERPAAHKPAASKPSIFDKLTDPKLYTGTHVHRFDAEGHGRGKAGRDPGIDSQTHDLSQMTRPALDTGATVPHGGVESHPPAAPAGTKPRTPPTATATRAAAPAAHPPAHKAAAPGEHRSIFDKLTDSSLYTGTHSQRFDAQGRGRGLAGRDSGIDSQTHDLSQMTRTNLGSGATVPHVPHAAHI